MAIILDIIVLAIFLVTVIVATKRGFIKSIIGTLSLVCAIIGAKLFSPAVSKIFNDMLTEKYLSKIEEYITSHTDSIPLIEQIKSLVKIPSSTPHILAENVISFLATALAYIIIFLVILLAVRVLGVFLNTIFKAKFLKEVNKTLGLLLGLAEGLLFLLVFIGLAQLLVPFISSVYPDVINEDIINKTFVFKFLYNMEWINFFVN